MAVAHVAARSWRASQARRWRSRGSLACGILPAPPPGPPSSQRWPAAAPQGHRRAVYPGVSHAIPLTPYRTTHPHRWNCNVCRNCRKFTQSNCMRNCSECALPTRTWTLYCAPVRPCHRVDARAHRQTERSSLADSSLSHRLTSTARDGGCVVDDEAGAPRG